MSRLLDRILGDHPGMGRLLAACMLAACLWPVSVQAYYGHCGQPASTGANVLSADALYALQASVGSKPLAKCVGDVNSDGDVDIDDATLILQKASEYDVTLSCPNGAECADCNASTLQSKIDGMANGQRATDKTSLVIRCPNASKTFTVPSTWSAAIYADDAILSGYGRNYTFVRHTTCPSTEPSSGKRFIDIDGDNSVVSDLTVRRFWAAIEVSGADNTVERVTLDQFCNTGVRNFGSASGTELRDSTLKNSSQQGVRVHQGTVNNASHCHNDDSFYETSTDRECYNIAVHDTLFTNVDRPVRFAADGRFLVKGGRMTDCDYPLVENTYEDPDYYVRFDGVQVDDCNGGMEFRQDAIVFVDNGLVESNPRRGIIGRNSADVTIDNTVIRYNGGTTASGGGGHGGVATLGSATALLVEPTGADPGSVVCENIDNNSAYLQLDPAFSGSIVVETGNYVDDLCP